MIEGVEMQLTAGVQQRLCLRYTCSSRRHARGLKKRRAVLRECSASTLCPSSSPRVLEQHDDWDEQANQPAREGHKLPYSGATLLHSRGHAEIGGEWAAHAAAERRMQAGSGRGLASGHLAPPASLIHASGRPLSFFLSVFRRTQAQPGS